MCEASGSPSPQDEAASPIDEQARGALHVAAPSALHVDVPNGRHRSQPGLSTRLRRARRRMNEEERGARPLGRRRHVGGKHGGRSRRTCIDVGDEDHLSLIHI